MSVNIRTGLFRLWVVGSILFAVSVGVVFYSGIRDEFKSVNIGNEAIGKQLGWSSGLLPVKCGNWFEQNAPQNPTPPPRGISGTDYSEFDGFCLYSFADFRRLYPEYNNLNDNKLAELLYEMAGQPLKHFHPWQKLGKVIALAFEVPLAVLVLGWALLWAVSGFRATE